MKGGLDRKIRPEIKLKVKEGQDMNRLAKNFAFVSVFGLILFGGWMLGVPAAKPSGGVTTAKKPNIVFILADDGLAGPVIGKGHANPGAVRGVPTLHTLWSAGRSFEAPS